MIYICVPTTKERAERLEVLKESLRINAGEPYIFCTYENYREGFVKPIHKMLSGLKDDTLVWCIGDDTKLIEPDTLKRLKDNYIDGHVIQPDDGIQHGQIITMPFCSAKTMRDKGVHLEFFLNFCDNIFTELMTKEGKYIYCPDIQVDHQHWCNKKAAVDETYAYAQSKFEEDQRAYLEVKKKLNL